MERWHIAGNFINSFRSFVVLLYLFLTPGWRVCLSQKHYTLIWPGLKPGPVILESNTHTSGPLSFAMLRAALAIGSCSGSYDWRSFTPFGIEQLFYGSNFIDRRIYSLSVVFI